MVALYETPENVIVRGEMPGSTIALAQTLANVTVHGQTPVNNVQNFDVNAAKMAQVSGPSPWEREEVLVAGEYMCEAGGCIAAPPAP